MAKCAVIIHLLLLGLAYVSTPLHAADAVRSVSDVNEAMQRVLAKHRYQTELPNAAPRTSQPNSSRSRQPGRTVTERPAARDDVALSRSPSPSNLTRLLFWAFLLGVAVVIVLAVVRGGRRAQPKSVARDESDDIVELDDFSQARSDPAPSAKTSHDTVALARRLYAQGRFSDAVRELLLAAMVLLDEAGFKSSSCATSREIAIETKEQPMVYASISSLVHIVERTRFAGGAPARPDIEDYIRSFESLSRVLDELCTMETPSAAATKSAS